MSLRENTAAKAYLVMENGAWFEGKRFGAAGDVTGEIVFTTSMTGYLETLTDPSYHGQIVLQTFPLIGNYGVISEDFESPSVGAKAYIVKFPCQDPSNFRSEGDLDTFLSDNGIIGLYDIDTRALTKIIREKGVMNGKITSQKPYDVNLEEIKAYTITDAVKTVSSGEKTLFKTDDPKHTVALLDFGVKANIVRELNKRRCDVWVLPYDSTPADIESVKADGVMLSNGPGDPAENEVVIENLQKIKDKLPVFGICLGHQLLALACGFKTHKLKFGHRGANQPVKDLETGRLYITSQNHGYAVSSDAIESGKAKEWIINVNDKTCEGLIYKDIPAFSVQFHPEACGGPQDTVFLFDRFIALMDNFKNKKDVNTHGTK